MAMAAREKESQGGQELPDLRDQRKRCEGITCLLFAWYGLGAREVRTQGPPVLCGLSGPVSSVSTRRMIKADHNENQ